MYIVMDSLYSYYTVNTSCSRVYYLDWENPIDCPACGNRLYSHGTCRRHVRWLDNDEIWVLVVAECRHCSCTHRLLPESVIPGKLCLAEEFARRFYHFGGTGKDYFQSTKWVLDLLDGEGEKLTRKEVRGKYTEAQLDARIKEINGFRNHMISS